VGWTAGGLSPPLCGQLTRCFSAVAELLVINNDRPYIDFVHCIDQYTLEL